ncbi:Tigger transposable element-derived protein 7-like 69, partial [Homarus americanus]
DKELEEAWYKWFVQQRDCGVKVRGVEIAEALISRLSIWVFHSKLVMDSCGGSGIAMAYVTGSCVQAQEVEPFRQKLNQLIKDEGLNLAQIYNADETRLF